ncbi:hypothetical protein DRO97_01450, partial [Archaeoglobales archaeon]
NNILESEDALALESKVRHYSDNNILKCDHCGKSPYGLVFCIPEIETTYEILKKYMSDEVINALNNLKKTYDILSKHFVHSSVSIDFADTEFIFNINNQEVNLRGFDGLKYVLRNSSLLLCDYYMVIKNRFDFEWCLNVWKDKTKNKKVCSLRAKKFEDFNL